MKQSSNNQARDQRSINMQRTVSLLRRLCPNNSPLFMNFSWVREYIAGKSSIAQSLPTWRPKSRIANTKVVGSKPRCTRRWLCVKNVAMPLALRQHSNLGKFEATAVAENCCDCVNNTSRGNYLAYSPSQS